MAAGLSGIVTRQEPASDTLTCHTAVSSGAGEQEDASSSHPMLTPTQAHTLKPAETSPACHCLSSPSWALASPQALSPGASSLLKPRLALRLPSCFLLPASILALRSGLQTSTAAWLNGPTSHSPDRHSLCHLAIGSLVFGSIALLSYISLHGFLDQVYALIFKQPCIHVLT